MYQGFQFNKAKKEGKVSTLNKKNEIKQNREY